MEITTAKQRAWARALWNNYRLLPEQWDAVYVFQRGVCWICGRPNKSGARLSTDHRHKDGFFRGLLCSQCNRALGKIEDPRWQWGVEQIVRLLEYLRNPPAVQALGVKVYGFPGEVNTKRHKKWIEDNSNTPQTPIAPIAKLKK
jgi:hypothetical protein